MLDDHVARRHGDSRTFFDIETLENTVVDNRGVALRAKTETEARTVELEAHCLGEISGAIGEHQDVGCALRLLPRFHHPRVVHADTGDGLDTLRLQFIEALHEARKVNLRTTGCEGARYRKEHDLAFAENFCRAHGRRHAVIAQDVNLDVGNLVSW